MRKLSLMFVAFALSFVMVSCSNVDNGSPSKDKDPVTPPPAKAIGIQITDSHFSGNINTEDPFYSTYNNLRSFIQGVPGVSESIKGNVYYFEENGENLTVDIGLLGNPTVVAWDDSEGTYRDNHVNGDSGYYSFGAGNVEYIKLSYQFVTE